MRRKDRASTIGREQESGPTDGPTAAADFWSGRPPFTSSGATGEDGRDDALATPSARDESEAADLFQDGADGSAALANWKDRLSQYVDRQGPLDALRLRTSSEPPWPGADNPMLGYLTERCAEIADEEGLDAALDWFGANAWFEGVIAERARITRLIFTD